MAAHIHFRVKFGGRVQWLAMDNYIRPSTGSAFRALVEKSSGRQTLPCRTLGRGWRAQAVKCLLLNCGNKSLILRTHVKM